MRVFIAGQTRTGERTARRVVESMSSARPSAILAMKFAVAGATTARSAASVIAMCSVWPFSSSKGSALKTRFPVRFKNVLAPTSFSALAVSTAFT